MQRKQTKNKGYRAPKSARGKGESQKFVSIHETYSQIVQTSAASILSRTYDIDAAVAILAARLTGYQALRDEYRLDRVIYRLRPIYGTNAVGKTVMYIERDAAAAAVASPELALDQTEMVWGKLSDSLTICWRPQEPMDHEFNKLNPGTTSLGKLIIVGNNYIDGFGVVIPNATGVYTLEQEVYMTLRGRP